MKKLTLFLLLLLPVLLPAQSRPTSQPPSQAKPLVFTHVTVIDATGAEAQLEITVVITGGRITALGESRKVKIPRDAQVVDATGKFLIPGLWDMHTHLAVRVANKVANKQVYLPLLVANGITGVRDMLSELETINQWRKEITAGTLLAPHIVAAGEILDGPGSREFTVVSNAAEGRQAVTKVKQEGSDFVKVYSLLPRDAYFAIADEARKQNIPFEGHVPLSVTVAEASDAGQKSIEHLTGMVLACSTREAELRKEFAEMPQADMISNYSTFIRVEARSIESYSEEKARLLFARLVKNGTWQCPTLVVLRALASLDDPNFTNDPRLKYMTPATRQRWKPNSNTEGYAVRKKLYLKQLELVGAMRRAGVGILAGTDMANPYVFPGFSLHDELDLMVNAGLTPMEALQAATRNPAQFLGLEKTLGTIEPGKIADLVLLEANPLQDISNTKKINAVVVRGRLLDRAKLDQMLADVEAFANQDQSNSHGSVHDK